MTATIVDGLEVIADEPTPSPISDRAGNRIIWTQTRTLLLADGSTIYGCQHCDYTSPNVNSIRPHLSKHIERGPKNNGRKAKPEDLSLNQLLARLGELSAVESDRDRWKARAQTAEKQLAALRRAIKGVTS
jgi:hypothetical protein